MFLTPERRGRLYTDLANAWWLHDRPDQAAAALIAAYRHTPGEIVDRHSVRTLAENLISNHGHLGAVRKLRTLLAPTWSL